jgi:ribosome-binding factor A
VSVLGSDAEVESTLAGLNDVGNRIKGQIGRTLRLRLAPELDFRRDETAAHASRIESLLQQIKAEESQKNGAADSDADVETDAEPDADEDDGPESSEGRDNR